MVKITKKALKKTEPQAKKYSNAVRVRKDNIKMEAHQHMIDRLLDVYGYDYINNKNMPKNDKERNEVKRIIQRNKGMFTVREFDTRIKKYFDTKKAKVTKVIAGATGKVVSLTDRSAVTLHGLCNHLGITVAKFKNYMNQVGYEDYHEIAQLAHQLVTEKLIEGALEGKLNASFSKWYLKNTSELDDKKPELSAKIEEINFLTVGSREEALQIKEEEENIIDVEVLDG